MTTPALPEHFSLMDFNGRVHRVEPQDFKIANLKKPCLGHSKGAYVGACYLTTIKAPKNAHLDGLKEYFIYLPDGKTHKVTEKDLDFQTKATVVTEKLSDTWEDLPLRILDVFGEWNLRIASHYVENLLLDENSEPRDAEREAMDNTIFFYVDWQEMLKSDEDLRAFVEESMVPDHSDLDHEGN